MVAIARTNWVEVQQDWFEPVDCSSLEANLAWREAATERAETDLKYRALVRRQCAKDIVYFLCGWAWLHEPREGKVIPFIPRPHQVGYLRTIDGILGKSPLAAQKCRDEGFTWMMVWFGIRDFGCKRHVEIGMCSSTEDKSDQPGIMSSIGGKLDWGIAQLPTWWLGRKGKRIGDGDWIRRADHVFVHNRLHNSITLDAATGEGPRSGRYYWYFFDEFGAREWQKSSNDRKALESVGDTTYCKIYISTPEERVGQFHRIMTEPHGRLTKIIMNWRDNPEKAAGLYRYRNGRAVPVDQENNPVPAEYLEPSDRVRELWDRLKKKGYTLDESTRSPWYDEKCDDPESTPEGIRKNTDGEFGGGVSHIFDDDFYRAIAGGNGMPGTIAQPTGRGTLSVHDDGKWEWIKDPKGDFCLWTPLDEKNRPPMHRYIVCADYSSGAAGPMTANSALHVIDIDTGVQVGRFKTNRVNPEDFTDFAIGVCRWFWDAHFAWETNQPGNVALGRLTAAKYFNFFYRRKLDKTGQTTTDIPGFLTDGRSKEILFSEFRFAVKRKAIIIRDEETYDECHQYIRHPLKHTIEHAGEGPGHGDMVIAIAVGYQAMKSRPVFKNPSEKDYDRHSDVEPPEGTFAWILWHARQKSGANKVMDQRTQADMAKAS